MELARPKRAEVSHYEAKYKHFCTKLKSLEFEINLNFSKADSGGAWEADSQYGVSREEENFIKAQKQMKLAQDITVNISQELGRNKTSFDRIIDSVATPWTR